jgi:hypothetical protein
VAISGALAATFGFALILASAYVVLALTRKTKPSFDSFYKLMAAGGSIAASVQLLFLIFFGERIQGLTGQDKFHLLVGAAAAGWYGVSGAATTFNKLFGVQLKEEPEQSEP